MGIMNKMFGDGLKPKETFVGKQWPYNSKQRGSMRTALILILPTVVRVWPDLTQEEEFSTPFFIAVAVIIVGSLFWYSVIYGIWTLVEKIRK